MRGLGTGLLVLSGVAACASTPPPALPADAVPAHFEQTLDATTPLWPSAIWWREFQDEQLDGLIAQAQAHNWDLFQASARVRQADARARQAGAALLPAVDLKANSTSYYGRTHVPSGTDIGRSQEVTDQETDYGAALAVSYDLDFWGKHRDEVSAARSTLRATRAERATVALTVTAGVASTYFALLAVQERAAIARANLASAQTLLGIVQRRVDAGYAASADLTQQRASVAALSAALPVLEQQQLEIRSALALLLGEPPEQLTLRAARLADIQAPVVQPGLPAQLLTRRPDLVGAESALSAAHADLALARKAYLPDISLTASGGVAYPAMAAAVDTLPGFGLAASAGASLTQAIFDGGRRHQKVEESAAREQELLGAYRAAILAALSDVENALGSLQHLTAQEAALRTQVDASQRVLHAAQRRYTAGSADFLAVTEAQRALYGAQDQLTDIQRARLAGVVALFKALGGGWESSSMSDTTSADPKTAPTHP
ncbi:MAG: efflux transporter outer membrane subunit [Proteobacteria bacterium]|nr:efflux transporter outer membrane subunit [Pseudomonadota bacterium]